MSNSEQPINPIVMENTLPGLAKREYFAGLAMQGMLSNPNTGTIENGQRLVNVTDVAKNSIEFADELLKQLQND